MADDFLIGTYNRNAAVTEVQMREFFATAPRGMEPLLAQELQAMFAEEVACKRAGVSFCGSMEVAYRACLWSRIANRILLPLSAFSASTPDELYAGVNKIAWSQHLAADGSLAVDCQSVQSKIDHTHFAALKVKDAIVDQLRSEFGTRPRVELHRPDIRINVYLFRDQAHVGLDLAGESLHRRGYRKRGGEAPLKENLAAAILMRADWPSVAAAGGGMVDPMCGSGTLCIEAAMMAADIAPGLAREYFGFKNWRGFDASIWNNLIDEAKLRREKGRQSMPPVTGFDVDPAAVRTARSNAQEALLGGRVQIVAGELAEVRPPQYGKPDGGLVVVNPPYGERVGEEREIEPLYGRLGKHLKAYFCDWNAAVFTGNPKLAGSLRLRPRRSYTLFNGPLKCRLLCYNIGSSISENNGSEALHVSSEVSETPSTSSQMFANRLRKNRRRLGRWASRNSVTCYRIYDADLPEYALAIDMYKGEKMWLHIQEYAPPSSVAESAAARRREEGIQTAAAILDVPHSQIFFKTRRQQKRANQYEKQRNIGRFHEVSEGDFRFWINLSDYLDTGLFLDQRLTREMIAGEIKTRSFLNLFGYTGAASVAAAVGGASSTTTVDLSKTYLDWAQRNLGLNGYTGTEHEFVQADVGQWLHDQRIKPRRRYGLIWLDPPTFSNSKRMERSFDVQREHPTLIRDAITLLEPGGLLLFSNNFRRFKLDRTALTDLAIDDISSETLPPDFERRSRYHNCWRIMVQ